MARLRESDSPDANKFKSLHELDVDNMDFCLSKFFMCLVKQSGQLYNAASLITHYSALARCIAEEYEIDIRKDPRFKKSSDTLKARCKEAAEAGNRPGKHASSAVQENDIKAAFSSGSLGRANPESLLALVHYTLTIGCGVRCVQEAYIITNEDMIYGPRSPSGEPEWIQLSERITETRRGNVNQQSATEMKGRIYLDLEAPEICPIKTILLFQSKKTPAQLAPNIPFLLNPKLSALKNPENEIYWFSSNRCGRNKISSLFKNALVKSGADLSGQKITANSARKTMIQSGCDSLVPGVFISKMTGQAGLDSKLHYLQNREKTHQAASITMTRHSCGKTEDNFHNIYEKVKKSPLADITNVEPPTVSSSEVKPPVIPSLEAGPSHASSLQTGNINSNLMNVNGFPPMAVPPATTNQMLPAPAMNQMLPLPTFYNYYGMPQIMPPQMMPAQMIMFPQMINPMFYNPPQMGSPFPMAFNSSPAAAFG